jgi:predicted MFS family arabinose efflux permease
MEAPIDRRLVALFAVACGASLANIYYAQPLLPAIAAAFGVSDGAVTVLVTIPQIAYAIGLVLIVPLGDLLDRRRLIPVLLGFAGLALAAAAAAPSLAVLTVALAVGALASVVVQVLLPFAALLARPAERGHVVGLVMTGTLAGALLARTLSGLLAALGGWRLPFAFAAALSLAMALVLLRALPARRPPASVRYHRLLASVGRLIRDEAALRQRMVYGACGFAGFTLIWTTLPFALSAAPWHLGSGAIGLFGLAGIAGALGARGIGRRHDRGQGRAATGAMLLAILFAWPVLLLGDHWLPAMALGLILIDLGVQGQNVLSQGVIYALDSDSASRVTTAYVTSNFAAGALGSAVGARAWSLGGWTAVCLAGAILAAIALTAWWLAGAGRASAGIGANPASPEHGQDVD